MKLSVLNPRGNDAELLYPDGAGGPDDAVHPPVNYHGFAACTGGGFFRKTSALPAETPEVLVLIRRNLKAVREAVTTLRSAGKTVAVAWKEAGAWQVSAQLHNEGRLQMFREICAAAHGAIATTPDLLPLFRSAGAAVVEFIPTPYPVADPRWDFSGPREERRGIFLGTREFSTPSRNHLAALLALKPLAEARGEPVTVCNVEGWKGRRMLRGLRYAEGLLEVVEGQLPYSQYLQRLARHKIVFQLDASAVPGQVAGDALLCRVPCMGGNGATERLIFPELCGHGQSSDDLQALAERLLESPAQRASAVERALALSTERLAFAPVAAALATFFARLRA